jgi:hypothetical protein
MTDMRVSTMQPASENITALCQGLRGPGGGARGTAAGKPAEYEGQR